MRYQTQWPLHLPSASGLSLCLVSYLSALPASCCVPTRSNASQQRCYKCRRCDSPNLAWASLVNHTLSTADPVPNILTQGYHLHYIIVMPQSQATTVPPPPQETSTQWLNRLFFRPLEAPLSPVNDPKYILVAPQRSPRPFSLTALPQQC